MRSGKIALRMGMQKPVAMAVITAAALLAACSTAPPEDKAIVAKEQLCSACHGPDGKSASVPAPVLAGQR
jgi:cytochrome c553